MVSHFASLLTNAENVIFHDAVARGSNPFFFGHFFCVADFIAGNNKKICKTQLLTLDIFFCGCREFCAIWQHLKRSFFAKKMFCISSYIGEYNANAIAVTATMQAECQRKVTHFRFVFVCHDACQYLLSVWFGLVCWYTFFRSCAVICKWYVHCTQCTKLWAIRCYSADRY